MNSHVSLKIFDEVGKEIITLVNNEEQNAGTHKVVWHGKDGNDKAVSSGTYFYQLQINNNTVTNKAVYVK